MSDPVITLTTDFGEASPYVAAMKGVILSINPAVRLLDLSHQIPPQDLRHAAFFLVGAIPYHPAGVIHVVVVDPGVGTERAVLYVEIAGHRLLVPDNGCWTVLAEKLAAAPTVIRATERRFWRANVSNTFHGRDIFAPTAAQLSLGVEPRQLGPTVSEWQRLSFPVPRSEGNALTGEVLFVDHFGNLITNIPADVRTRMPAAIRVAEQSFTVNETMHWVRTYGEATTGTLVALISSAGLLEIAVVQGSAAARLNAAVGVPISVIGAR